MTAERLAQILFEDRRLQRAFVVLVGSEQVKCSTSKSEVAAAAAAFLQEKAVEIDTAKMHLLSPWYMLPAADAFTLKNPPHTTTALAKLLGITLTQAEEALETLINVGILDRSPIGFRKTSRKVTFAKKSEPNLAVRDYHRGMINRALESMDQDPVDQRYFFGRTVAIRYEQYDDIIEHARVYLDRLSELAFEAGDEADSLFQSNIQVFELSRGRGKK